MTTIKINIVDLVLNDFLKKRGSYINSYDLNTRLEFLNNTLLTKIRTGGRAWFDQKKKDVTGISNNYFHKNLQAIQGKLFLEFYSYYFVLTLYTMTVLHVKPFLRYSVSYTSKNQKHSSKHLFHGLLMKRRS